MSPQQSDVPTAANRSTLKRVGRALIEICFIIFLFYANLLMGEFTASTGRGKTLVTALHDAVTRENFLIAIISACIGYAVFEFLRKKF